MIYLKLFLEFFHIGLFSFGGGYATLPFLYHIADVQKWYTTKQLSDMIAVSSITPGPVGVNVATFAGFKTAGILGAAIATTSVILPSFIIVIIISKLLEQFKHNKYVQSVIYTLKPAGCGLLAAIGVDMFIDNINLLGMVLLVCLFVASITEKRDPLFYLGVSAVVGLVAGFFNLTT
ncbi:TPA: chromate transporter [Candidatus Gastranaerophilales bacterium HUM_20]|nr:MAG TPA: chromate transporter [Candidatus Gastranaerophilales bacterium HUM_20]